MKLAILVLFLSATAADLSDIRTTYKDALLKVEKANELYTKTKNTASSSATHRAYYGTAMALQAKHGWNPSMRISKAKDAALQLNASVKEDPTNVEIHFLRFSFESNLPSMLGIEKHLGTDKAYILAHLSSKHAIWPVMKSFLQNCELLTESEKKRVQNLK